MSVSTAPNPATNHSGWYSCWLAWGVAKYGSSGSHRHMTVVTPAAFIWATTLVAVCDSWLKSSG